MSYPPSTPEARFATIVEGLLSNPDVTPPSDGKSFGSSGLKIQDKIFAMLVRGKLVVKLPKSRVDALIAAGMGERFDPRHDGRLMKEWITIEPTFAEQWLNLSREALQFVASKR
ncbi:MAG: TfoX/Sxy family protein [Ktedonobacteraceae bacterium]|nr:TfoX/Sxy family protein [Chloroflexota bacterium]